MTAWIGALGRASAASECTVMTAPGHGPAIGARTVIVTDAAGNGTGNGRPDARAGTQQAGEQDRRRR